MKFAEWLKSLGMIDESIQKKKEAQETGLSLTEQEKEQLENKDCNEENENRNIEEEKAAIMVEEE